jgi:hypothetical protein
MLAAVTDDEAREPRDLPADALLRARRERQELDELLDGRETHTSRAIVDALEIAGLSAWREQGTGRVVFHDAHGNQVGSWMKAVARAVEHERELLRAAEELRRDET